jgi:hypothetical protein
MEHLNPGIADLGASFSILHGPTPDERLLMEAWIRDLTAFVWNDQDFQYGTTARDEFKVLTHDGRIEVQKDERWDELLRLADDFASL